MSAYRRSTLTAEAPGIAETITRWDGQTMGGYVPAFMTQAQKTGGLYFRNPPSVYEGLRQTGLDSEVRLENLQADVTQESIDLSGNSIEIHTAIEMPGFKVTTLHYNDGRPPMPVSPVTPSYQPVQNTEALAAGQEIVSQGAGALVALGAWGRPLGSRTYAAFALDGMLVGGQDPHGLFLTITNWHDGMGGLTFRLAPIRFDCTNEAPLYFGPKSRRITPVFARKHTRNVLRDAAVYAAAALNLAAEYREVFPQEAEKALGVKVAENKAITYWRQVFGVPEAASDWKPGRQTTLNQNREDALVRILNSDTCDFGRRTAWGAFNAVTEYLDHEGLVRGGDAQSRRALRILEGDTDKAKQRAWDLALAI